MDALERILELTRRVEEHVDRGAWLEAGAIDAERRELLNAVLSANDIRQLDAAARQTLREVLARNQQTVEKVQAQQTELGRASARLNQVPGAMRAYRANASPCGTAWAPPDTDKA
jgi:plasmid stability protein